MKSPTKTLDSGRRKPRGSFMRRQRLLLAALKLWELKRRART